MTIEYIDKTHSSLIYIISYMPLQSLIIIWFIIGIFTLHAATVIYIFISLDFVHKMAINEKDFKSEKGNCFSLWYICLISNF